MTLYALLVGVNEYTRVRPSLAGCVNDAIAMRKFLLESAKVREEDLRILLSPSAGEVYPELDVTKVPRADRANVTAALAELATKARYGDHVIVYFAGHGVRVINTATNERVYGFAPADTAPRLGGGYDNLVYQPELRESFGAVMAAGGTISVLLDTCHSGGATREVDERGLPPIELSPAEWAALFSSRAGDQPEAEPVPEEPMDTPDAWVTFSACKDTETAKEQRQPEPHGAFTLSLLAALQTVPAEAVRGQRWMDLAPLVRAAVQRLVDHKGWSAQTPVLEGAAEKLVFGGQWTPFAPGFDVYPRPDGLLALDGGVLHGLDVDAEIAVFPPETANFSPGGGLRARIVGAEPAASYARLLDPGAKVNARSRATLVAPSPARPKLRVALRDVAEGIARGIGFASDLATFVSLVAPGEIADLEIVPWPGEIPAWDKVVPSWCGAIGGLAIVPYAPARAVLTADDVIAYVPPPGAPDVGDVPEKVGEAIGWGLVHWAKYLAVLRRASTDPGLRGAIQVTLRAGADKATAQVREPDASGLHRAVEGEPLWIVIDVKDPPDDRLVGGVIACSNDGNIMIPWPPDGADPTFDRGTIFVGRGRDKPLQPTVRRDQTSSLYTFKVVVYTAPSDGAPVKLGALALEQTVQDCIAAVAVGDHGGLGSAAPSSPVAAIWDLPVRILRKVE
jgi:uncharacterized caspase-like protein